MSGSYVRGTLATSNDESGVGVVVIDESFSFCCWSFVVNSAFEVGEVKVLFRSTEAEFNKEVIDIDVAFATEIVADAAVTVATAPAATFVVAAITSAVVAVTFITATVAAFVAELVASAVTIVATVFVVDVEGPAVVIPVEYGRGILDDTAIDAVKSGATDPAALDEDVAVKLAGADEYDVIDNVPDD